ncbi:hypothetical protein BDW22DRAFT_1420743 [Trametopsis cervina]|nr:hypothetical protein BDW22DRAFT_1420743 [Trametopsis cervina]
MKMSEVNMTPEFNEICARYSSFATCSLNTLIITKPGHLRLLPTTADGFVITISIPLTTQALNEPTPTPISTTSADSSTSNNQSSQSDTLSQSPTSSFPNPTPTHTVSTVTSPVPSSHSPAPASSPLTASRRNVIGATMGGVLGVAVITLVLLEMYRYRRRSRRVHVREMRTAVDPFLAQVTANADQIPRSDEASETSSVFVVASPMGATAATSSVRDSSMGRTSNDEEHAYYGAEKETAYSTPSQPGVRTPTQRNTTTSASELSEAPPSYHSRESAEYVLDIGGNNMGGGS